jgi:hypothetical protein
MKTYTLPDFDCVKKIDNKYLHIQDNILFRVELQSKSILNEDFLTENYINRINKLINLYTVMVHKEQVKIGFVHEKCEYNIFMSIEVMTILMKQGKIVLRPTINNIIFEKFGDLQIYIIPIDFDNILSWLEFFQ